MEKKIKIDKIIIIYFILLIVVCFFRFPDIKDEYKYIYLTDNLVERKNFMILKYFGQLYPDKPPLYFWLLVVLKDIFGDNFFPIALILGSLLPMIIISYKTLNFINRMETSDLGIEVYKLFITIPFVVGISLILRMDMLLTLWIVLAIYMFFSRYYLKDYGSKNSMYMMYIYIALGILTKGGAGFVVPILTILTFLFLDKNLTYLKNIKFWKGILLICSIIGIWFLFLSQISDGEEYIKLMLGRETLGRVLSSKTHVRPFYFYLAHTPLTFFIATPFVFLQLYKLSRKIKEFKNWETIDKISYCWFVPNFIFFSMCSGKLDIYLLPIYPAMLILAVRFLDKELKKYIKGIIRLQFLIVIIVVCGSIYYTNNYTLKNLIADMRNYDVVHSYRFNDAKNLYYTIGNKEIGELGDDDLIKIKYGDLMILKKKNMKNLKGIRYTVVSKNKNYVLLKIG